MQPPAQIDLLRLSSELNAITGRQALVGARIGIAVQPLGEGHLVYEREADQLFVAASTTKIPTCASALAALGPDYRFTTVVRASGAVDEEGTLHGDLLLVAAGDPNLSNRIVEDRLEFRTFDHAMAGVSGSAAIPRDPLAVLRSLARGVATHGIRRVSGKVRVDLCLFPERDREGGTGAYVSPITVNDNLIDVELTSGETEGTVVGISSTPITGYVCFIAEAVTAPAGSLPQISFDEVGFIDGIRAVAVRGTMPASSRLHFPYTVREPGRFAATVFTEVLVDAGIRMEPVDPHAPITGRAATDDPIVASHTSPPLREAVKVVLKVSQNLHAQMLPAIVGSIAANAPGEGAMQAGFDAAQRTFAAWMLDADGARQGDGCGAIGFFTPRYMCSLLSAIAAQPFAADFEDGLPVLGKDGTLHDIQTGSPAAGHVKAKTGTLVFIDRLNRQGYLTSKALAGYVDAASGARYTFAAYVNGATIGSIDGIHDVGEMLGEIATALYTYL